MMGALGQAAAPEGARARRAVAGASTRWGEHRHAAGRGVVDRRRRARAARLRVPVHDAAPRPARRRQPAARRRRSASAYDQLEPGVRPRLQRPAAARGRHAEGRRGRRRRSSRRCGSDLADDAGRRRGRAREPSARTARWPTICVIPTTSPQDATTSDLVDRPARATSIPAATQGTPLKVYVGGKTAGVRGHLGQGRRAPAAVHRGRHRPVGPAADGGVPLALGPARLGRLQPAVDRRRLRRRRRGVPEGRGASADRRRQRRRRSSRSSR